ncbi:pentatricopeptide repeat protein [Rutstroemia sp. NJR-2017a BVV2]|nr:pentatricopeptide repeat protein [Rutstroemia sp. NJR-2017a BVV2]
MPLIPNPLIRPWSPSELPILPFLAPRLLEPWTTKRRRACLEPKANYSQHSSVSSVAGDRGRIPLKCSTSRGPDDVAQPQTRRYYSSAHARSWKCRNHRLYQGGCALFSPRGAVRQLSSEYPVSENEKEVEPPLRAGDDSIEGPGHHHVRVQDEPDTAITRNRSWKGEGPTHRDQILVPPSKAQISSASSLQSRAAPLRKQRRRENQVSAELHSLYRRFAEEAGLRVLSTKYVSVLQKPSGASEFGFTFHWWSTKFSVINQIHEDELQGYPKVPDIDDDLPKFPLATRLLFIKQNNVSSLASFWRRVPKETRCHVWAEIMITAMEKHPDSALKCLIATYQDPFPPSWAVSDCLNFIISHYFSTANGAVSRESFQLRDFQSILRSVQYLLYRGAHASQRSLSLLQAIMNDEEFNEFYSILEMAGHHLNGKSLLRFVYRAARARNTDLAFKILQRAPLQGINLGLERWPQICSVLLVRRYRDPDAEVSETELFEYMLRNGFRPGITTYNILIQNSVQAGDSETAWQIYEMILKNGIIPDGYTFSILIHDAKLRRDGAAIGKLASLMAEYGIQNAHATTDILDAVSRIHKAEYHQTLSRNRKHLLTAFPRIIPLYMEVFALEPLIEIIPGFSERFLPHARSKVVDTTNDHSKDDHPPSIHHPGGELSDSLAVMTSDAQDGESGLSSKQDLLEPSVATLNVMLQSYCDYLESSRNAAALLELYDHFQDLVSKRRPVIAPLARDPRFYNYMLSALGSCYAPLEDCLRIIKDMQAPYIHNSSESGKAESEEVETVLQSEADQVTEPDSSNGTPDLFRPPQPNIHTWTSMLHIFMHRRQPRAAEKVLQIMFEKGMRPNAATWNALTTGYMRLQDPAMVADSFNRSTEAGYSPRYAMSSRWWFKFKPKDVLAAALRATVTNSPTTLDDMADVIGSRDSPSSSVSGEDDSSAVPADRGIDTVAAETTDIYSTKKRRLVTANSPVYPNWMFDALLRLAEKDVMVHGKSESASVPQALSVGDPEQFQEANVSGETSRLPVNKMITRRVRSSKKPLARRKLQSIRDSIRSRKEQIAEPYAREGNEST